MPSSRQLANDQLAWLELPQATKRGLVGWLDEALPVARAVNCHGESGLVIVATANEITLLVVGMPGCTRQRSNFALLSSKTVATIATLLVWQKLHRQDHEGLRCPGMLAQGQRYDRRTHGSIRAITRAQRKIVMPNTTEPRHLRLGSPSGFPLQR